MEELIKLTRGELFVIRDALQEQEEEDVREALAIVEGALYNPHMELEFDD